MFKLLRYFSLTSAAAILSVTVVLVVLYRHNAVNDLVEIAERQNVELARALSNTIWPRFSAYVTGVSGLDGDALRARPETRQIHEALKTLSAGLPVLKVKIYNLDGLTVFSSQASQIGEDKSNSPSFLASVREGKPASKQAHEDRFSSLSGELLDRELVESYLPIRRGDGPIEGVFELYSDVTPLMARIERTASSSSNTSTSSGANRRCKRPTSGWNSGSRSARRKFSGRPNSSPRRWKRKRNSTRSSAISPPWCPTSSAPR
jgi:hypothetical protein